MIKTLKSFDLLMLALMILSLPSLEAPKNIFLVAFLVTRIIFEFIQFKAGEKQWGNWDNLFSLLVFTAFLSTFYAGMPNLEEWKGYKVFLTALLTGWLISRAHYSKENYEGLFKLIVLGTIPPLAWGLFEYLIIHTRSSLEVHSVGHVNHSAIYLVIIFGASLGWFLSQFKSGNKTSKNSYFFVSALTLIFFISLIIGQSRGAFGIAIILGLLLTFLLAKNKKIGILISTTIISIVFCTIFFKANIIQKQITNQENQNILAYRDKVWNVSIEASRLYPLLGIGMSNWHFISKEQLKNSVEKRGGVFNPDIYAFPGHSHNIYLTALVERGIIGILVTLLFMGCWFQHLIKTFAWAKKTKLSMRLWAGSISAWIATFGIGFVNTTFHHEHAILSCLFLGLYLSYTTDFTKKKAILN
jgi:O-antigen ligase